MNIQITDLNVCMLPELPQCSLIEVKNRPHLLSLLSYNKQAGLTLDFKNFYRNLSLLHVVARFVPGLKSSFLKNLFPDLSFVVCTITYHRAEQRGGGV